MKITTVPINHKIKHLEPIFTITKGQSAFASGGINGEMKLWDLEYNFIKTVKKHQGSLSCVRFSLDNKFLASSGDDGKVYIFDAEGKDVLKTIKHNNDVTQIEWTHDFIISSDIDGIIKITRIQDFTEFRSLHDHESAILGFAFSSDFKMLCSFSEGKIVLYEDFNIKSTKNIKKGVVLEKLSAKISFSPNNKLISVGMQFNKKLPVVDIFDLNLNTTYSLVGHVAPSEVTAFCPFAFKKIHKYFILAVASQDLSLSLWNTLNPKPFVLLKNFTDSPILDMFWDDLTLYVSSYDGLVRKIEFDEVEFGERVFEYEDDQIFELPYNEKNIDLQKNYEKRIERLDFDEKIDMVKLEGFSINDIPLEALIQNQSNDASNAAKTDSHNNAVTCNNTTEKADSENKNGNSQSSFPTLDNTMLSVSKDNNLDPLPKRIAPVMVNKVKSLPVYNKKSTCSVVLYDTAIPEKIKMTKVEKFKIRLGDYAVELKESGDIAVYRALRPFYTISGPCNKVCFNDRFLVVFTTHIQIYELATSTIALPFICAKISFLDLLDDLVFYLDVYGDFTVLDIVKKKSTVGKLPKTKNLSKIQLSRTHFLVAEYSDGEIIFYDKKMKTWFSINPHFNSVTTNGVDFQNDNDDTLAELELTFVHYELLKDQKNMKATFKQFVALVKRIKKLEDFVEYKLERMLRQIADKKFLELVLEEMNREAFLQKFVVKMCRELEIN